MFRLFESFLKEMKNKRKTIQLHTVERLENDQKVSPEKALEFLHEFSLLAQGEDGPRKLISIRVPVRLLQLFKAKATREGKRYQTEILRLIAESLEKA
jgi:predicted DNA binding CopG/RHH family protein